MVNRFSAIASTFASGLPTTWSKKQLAERAGVLFAGDALATVSLLDGSRGPQLMPFNEDANRARESLSRLGRLAAGMVVVGHGDPFEGTPGEAVEAAGAKPFRRNAFG